MAVLKIEVRIYRLGLEHLVVFESKDALNKTENLEGYLRGIQEPTKELLVAKAKEHVSEYNPRYINIWVYINIKIEIPSRRQIIIPHSHKYARDWHPTK